MSEKKLTPKQEIFISEYLIDFNATRAAKAAGYSEDTASVIGYENLTKPYLKEIIQKKINQALGINSLTLRTEIIKKLKEKALVSDNEDVSENAQMKALELLGKYDKMFTDKIEHTTIGEDGEPKGFIFVDPPKKDADTK